MTSNDDQEFNRVFDSELQRLDFEIFCRELENPIDDPEFQRLLDPEDFEFNSSVDEFAGVIISSC